MGINDLFDGITKRIRRFAFDAAEPRTQGSVRTPDEARRIGVGVRRIWAQREAG